MKKVSILSIVLILTLLSSTAFAGEIDAFLKTGYFGWSERVPSHPDLAQEDGIGLEPGVAYTSRVIPFVALTGIASIKLSESAYTGAADVFGAGSQTSFRSDFSLKGEIKAAGEIPVTAILMVGPVIGANFEELFRLSGGTERWDIATVKAGAKGSYGPITVEGGITRPFYTVDNFSFDNKTYGLKPKGMVSPYAEANVAFNGRTSVSVFYEQARWGASDAITRPFSAGVTNGAFVSSTTVIQPHTNSLFVGVQLERRF